MNCPQWAARGARGVVKWRARAAGWYGLMPAAPLLGRVSAPRTAHRERIGAIEHGGNRRGCEAPLCVPFLLLVYGASGDRRAVMSDLLKLLLHDTVNSNPLDFAAPIKNALPGGTGATGTGKLTAAQCQRRYLFDSGTRVRCTRVHAPGPAR